MAIWYLRRAVPRQQDFEVFYCGGLRQPFKCVAQPSIGLLAVGFGRLDQTVKLSAGRRALGRVAESSQRREFHPSAAHRSRMAIPDEIQYGSGWL